MVAERKIALSDLNQSQIASVYPIPADAPSASPSLNALPAEPPPSPVSAATPEAPLPPAIAAESMPAAALPKPPLKPAPPPNPALAKAPAAPEPASFAERPKNSTASLATTTLSEKAIAPSSKGAGTSAPALTAEPHRKDFEIEINAFDRAAADRMVSRLAALGYASHVVPSQVDGQTSYQVEVGPYRSSAAAWAAQAKLQAAYTARYMNHSNSGKPGAVGAAAGTSATSEGSANTETSESGSSDTESEDSEGDTAPAAPTH
jgi:hypothetical protein